MSILKFKKEDVASVLAGLTDLSMVVLVGDHGIYLMSFASEASEGKPRPVAYAEGANPNTDEDYYDTKRDLYGGDDGGDDVGTVGEFKQILAQTEKHVIVKLTETTIEVRPDVQPRPKGKK